MALRYCLILLFLPCFLIAKAQRADIVVFAGPQVTTASYKIRDIKQPTGIKLGGMAGAALKVSFENQLYFFPAVYYSLKGYRVEFNQFAYPPTEIAENNSTRVHTLEIAPLFQVDFSKGPSHTFVRFGPSIDYAFLGREKFDTLGGDGKWKRKMPFSFGAYGRVTSSANLHVGYESVKGYQLFLHYAHGLGSMNNADLGPKIRHRIIGVSAGYTIHRKARTKSYRRKYR
jgi:hypothetical protein